MPLNGAILAALFSRCRRIRIIPLSCGLRKKRRCSVNVGRQFLLVQLDHDYQTGKTGTEKKQNPKSQACCFHSALLLLCMLPIEIFIICEIMFQVRFPFLFVTK